MMKLKKFLLINFEMEVCFMDYVLREGKFDEFEVFFNKLVEYLGSFSWICILKMIFDVF